MRSRQSLGDTDGFAENALAERRVEGVGSGEVNRAAQEFAEPALQADEREQADPGGGVIVHQQVDIARAACLAPQRRAEQAELPHRELLEHLSVDEKSARHVCGIHGRILPETGPGVKTHRTSTAAAHPGEGDDGG